MGKNGDAINIDIDDLHLGATSSNLGSGNLNSGNLVRSPPPYSR
uniref:Uncharacterized protein n=1 Tax=Anguilla anguilla TaxID=7936 RepID=A0A0E9XAR9_ANGAN